MKLRTIAGILIFLLMSVQANANHNNIPSATGNSIDAGQGNTIIQIESFAVLAPTSLWFFGAALIGFVATSRRTKL
ncbi:MAG: hypothetical protein OEQ39_29300 [Gammaproteobacteria bacterium]|nr:hypothetical protein [Gammaproteobacteria bacterium]